MAWCVGWGTRLKFSSKIIFKPLPRPPAPQIFHVFRFHPVIRLPPPCASPALHPLTLAPHAKTPAATGHGGQQG